MKQSLALVAFFLTAIVAAASEGSGSHGGGAISCENTHTIELLDYYEGRMKTSLGLDMGAADLSYSDRVRLVLKRLETIDPVAARDILSDADRFESEMQLVDEAQLKTIADSNELLNPLPGCQKTQFAVQVAEPKPFEKRYFVNQRLWEKSNSITRAGLVLHEVIYRHAIQYAHHQNSDGSRYFNFIISSQAMADMDNRGYQDLLRASGFLSADHFSLGFQGVLLHPGDTYSDARKNLKLAYPGQTLTLPVQGIQFKNINAASVNEAGEVSMIETNESQSIRIRDLDLLAAVGLIELFPGKTPKLRSLTVKNTFEFISAHGKLPLDGTVSFDENGIIASGELAVPSLKVTVQDQEIELLSGYVDRGYRIMESIEFFLSGKLKRALISGGVELLDQKGASITLEGTRFIDWYVHKQPRYRVEFTEDGKLVKWTKVEHECGNLAPFSCQD